MSQETSIGIRGVLFLCTANACRSQIAEGFARHLLPPEVVVGSAGTAPSRLDPRAVQVMGEVGIDISKQRSKSVDETRLADLAQVITLCGDAEEHCPIVPGARRDHWPIADPAGATGSSEEVLEAFRAARDEILHRVTQLASRFEVEPAVGIIGGSGFYELPGLTDVRKVVVDTPFGPPADALNVGRLGGRRVVFLSRHGEGHRLLPGEVNARANLYALKRMGVTRLVSVSAVGSLREHMAPGDVVLPRQFIDRTVGRPATYFGNGAVAHVSLADPICGALADVLSEASSGETGTVHRDGVYVCIEGPQFSTRAESNLFRSWGADLVGMTNLPEARLAREAELCYATLALPTDYDCWRARTEEVRVTDVLSTLRANVEKARRILARAVLQLDPNVPCSCRRPLDTALLTPLEKLTPEAQVRLHAIVARRAKASRDGCGVHP